eukprot:32748_1
MSLKFEITEFNETELAVLFGITFITSFVFANTGLGPDMISQIGYSSLSAFTFITESKLSSILVLLSFSKYPMVMIQCILQRKYILFQLDCAIIAMITYTTFTAIAIFTGILVQYQTQLFVRILGGLLLFSLIISCFKQHLFKNKNQSITIDFSGNMSKDTQETNSIVNYYLNNRYKKYSIDTDVIFYNMQSWQQYIILIVMSIISGLCHGLFGICGFPFIVYQLITNFDRRSFRVIMAFADGFGSGLITIVWLIFIDEFAIFDKSQWLIYVMIFIVTCIGLLVGNICAKYVDQKTFIIVMQLLLFWGTINLLLVDVSRQVSLYVNIGLAILFIVLGIGLIFTNCLLWMIERSNRDEAKLYYKEHVEEEKHHVSDITGHPMNALYQRMFTSRLSGIGLIANGDGMFVKEIKNDLLIDFENIQVGSKLIAIDGEIIEDIGAKEIMCRLNTYKLPINVIFLKPLQQRFMEMEIKEQGYNSEEMIVKNVRNIEITQVSCEI